ARWRRRPRGINRGQGGSVDVPLVRVRGELQGLAGLETGADLERFLLLEEAREERLLEGLGLLLLHFHFFFHGGPLSFARDSFGAREPWPGSRLAQGNREEPFRQCTGRTRSRSRPESGRVDDRARPARMELLRRWGARRRRRGTSSSRPAGEAAGCRRGR